MGAAPQAELSESPVGSAVLGGLLVPSLLALGVNAGQGTLHPHTWGAQHLRSGSGGFCSLPVSVAVLTGDFFVGTMTVPSTGFTLNLKPLTTTGVVAATSTAATVAGA